MDFQLMHDIINYREISPDTVDFWNMFADASQCGDAALLIAAVNNMLSGDFVIERTMNKNLKGLKIDLLTWLEVLRTIYMVKAGGKEHFSTFSRTFIVSPLEPQYWFDCGSGKSEEFASPRNLLLSLERYAYSHIGGKCVAAVDWNINKYVYRYISECADHEDPCAKIAALILTVHGIVNADLLLYLSEKQDISLPYAGVDADDKNLLKYFHFDRITRLSHIRQIELKLDAANHLAHPQFEMRWASLAALTEAILLKKNARATPTTCSRTGLTAVYNALQTLKVSFSCMKKNERNARAGQMIETGLDLVDDPKFSAMSRGEVLEHLGFTRQIITPDHYLRRTMGIDSAEGFWTCCSEIFTGVLHRFIGEKNKLQVSGSGCAAAGTLPDNIYEKQLLETLMINNQLALKDNLQGSRLRDALKNLIVEKKLQINPVQLYDLLKKSHDRTPLQLYIPEKCQIFFLPYELLNADLGTDAVLRLSDWSRNCLSGMTAANSDEKNEIDFNKVDFEHIKNFADELWNNYFGSGTDKVKTRYIISICDALAILSDRKKRKYKDIILVSGTARKELITHLNTELKYLIGDVYPDIEKLKSSYTPKRILSGFTPAPQRKLVIMEIMARLLVTSMKSTSFSTVISDDEKRNTLLNHLLAACGPIQHPLPFHLGIFSDSLLRMSRSANDQRDNIRRLGSGRFDNEAEAYVFVMFFTRYLKAEFSAPAEALKIFFEEQKFHRFFQPGMLKRLCTYFSGAVQ